LRTRASRPCGIQVGTRHFEGNLRAIRVDTGDPREVGVTFETKLTVRNAEGMQLRRMEIRGPEGPSVGTWERFEGLESPDEES
jgi:hypothetical protein